MAYFLQKKYLQKPRQWGPISAVRSAVEKYCSQYGSPPPDGIIVWGLAYDFIGHNIVAPTYHGAAKYTAGVFHTGAAVTDWIAFPAAEWNQCSRNNNSYLWWLRGNFGDASAYGQLFGKGNSSTANLSCILLDGSSPKKIRFWAENIGAVLTSTDTIEANKWYNISMYAGCENGLDGSLCKINGQLWSSATDGYNNISVTADAYPLAFGINDYSTGQNRKLANAQIDIVYLWNTDAASIDDVLHDNPYGMIQPRSMPIYSFASAAAGSTYEQALAGSFPAPSGALSHREIYKQPIFGDMPAPQATLLKKIMLSLTGAMPAASAGLVKSTGKTVSGIHPAPSGALVKKTSRSVAGNMPAATGGVSTALTGLSQLVFGNMPAAVGGVVKKIGKRLIGNAPAASGEITQKKTGKTVVGDVPPPSGSSTSGWRTSQSTAGSMPAPTGLLSTTLNPIVLVGKLLKIIGGSLKKMIGG